MSWDDLYLSIIRDIREHGSHVKTTSRGGTRELIGHQFELQNPRDRVTFNHRRFFNVFQTVGQWLWMAAGRSDFGFIRYYNPRSEIFSADRRQVEGAYGPRLFGAGSNWQIPRCVETLRQKPMSRQVIALVYEPLLDSHRHEKEGREGEIPCTLSLQFFLREGKLHCVTNMRSQSAVMLLPQDVCHFTMFQEFVAASVGAELGSYFHHSGSLHYYLEKPGDVPADEVLESHASDRGLMPAMEPGDQMKPLIRTLELEERIRVNAIDCAAQRGRRHIDSKQHFREAKDLPPFWRSIIHTCIGQAAIFVADKDILREYTPRVDPWLQPFFRRANELKGGERLLDNYGIIQSSEPHPQSP